MRKFSNRTKVSNAYLAEMTRKDLSPEVEADLSGLSINTILSIRQALEDTKGSDQYDAAWDAYVKALSIPLTDAAGPLGVPPIRLLKLMRLGWVDAFKHKNRWHIWLFDFHVAKDSGFLQRLPEKPGVRRRMPWLG